MSPTRGKDRRRQPSPQQDRAVAMGLWVFIGLLFGFAVGVFTGHGWLFLGLGLVLGLLLAVTRTRETTRPDED